MMIVGYFLQGRLKNQMIREENKVSLTTSIEKIIRFGLVWFLVPQKINGKSPGKFATATSTSQIQFDIF